MCSYIIQNIEYLPSNSLKELPLGTLIELKNKTIGMILTNDNTNEKGIYHSKYGLISNLSAYNDYGKHKILDDYSIVSISKFPASFNDIKRFCNNVLNKTIHNNKWIMIRQPEQIYDITIDEIERILGFKIKIISENEKE